MSLRAVLRSTAAIDLTAEGVSLAEINERMREQLPAGYELQRQTVQMLKGSTALTATGVARSTELREFEGDTLDAIRAAAGEGWQVQSVQRLSA